MQASGVPSACRLPDRVPRPLPAHAGFEDPIDAALDDVIGEANRGGFASPAGCTPGKVAGGSAAAVGTTPGPMSPHPSALSYPGTPKGQQPAALNDDQAFAARLLEQLQVSTRCCGGNAGWNQGKSLSDC